jgi:hypothetical protein
LTRLDVRLTVDNNAILFHFLFSLSRRIARRLGRHLLFCVNGTFVSEFRPINSTGVSPIIFDHREVFDAL